MAKISTQSSIENNKDNKRKKVYDDQSVDLIKQKLRPGESFRKHDGLFIFRKDNLIIRYKPSLIEN